MTVTPATAATAATTTSPYDSLTSASATGPATAVPQQSLGQSDFLQLLATQLASQDPSQPMDDTQFISQMANFSSLQQMQTLNTSFNSYASSQQAISAPEYLNKQITATDPNTGNPVTGVPSAVNIYDNSVTLTIGGQDFPLSAVTSVANAPAASTAATVANALTSVLGTSQSN